MTVSMPLGGCARQPLDLGPASRFLGRAQLERPRFVSVDLLSIVVGDALLIMWSNSKS